VEPGARPRRPTEEAGPVRGEAVLRDPTPGVVVIVITFIVLVVLVLVLVLVLLTSTSLFLFLDATTDCFGAAFITNAVQRIPVTTLATCFVPRS
jgi:hypothetical protein